MVVTLGRKVLPLPIIQGGMGIGVSLERLAGAVAARGGMGTISAAFCGFREPDFASNSRAEGDWENGLFFCGANAGEVNRLSTVGEQMDQIMNEWRAAT